ncbi:thioesterase II family protein [Streptomyces sp. NPDC015127]|uniref:thioesterase II family protein n=1 Tax=Streptomyces sp. NPDC015127 TaxID=3364939 RepID=UPI0036F985FF
MFSVPRLRDIRNGSERRVRAADGEEFTLFLVHHAGGSAVSFLPLRSVFPDHWRVLATELPGRGASIGEPACSGMAEAVSWLLPAVRAEITGPYAVVGHSMGALVARELVRELEAAGTPPVLLGVSASPAPHLSGQDGRYRNLRTREQLVRFLKDLGGTPDEVFEQPDLMDYLIEILRSDLAVLESYERSAGPVSVPIAVYYGERDAAAHREIVEPWSEYSTAYTTVTSWPGGHFYLFDHAETFGARLAHDVREAAAARVPHRESVWE